MPLAPCAGAKWHRTVIVDLRWPRMHPVRAAGDGCATGLRGAGRNRVKAGALPSERPATAARTALPLRPRRRAEQDRHTTGPDMRNISLHWMPPRAR